MAWTLGKAISSATSSPLTFTPGNVGDYTVAAAFVSSGSATITFSGGGTGTWQYLGATVAMTGVAGFSFRIGYMQTSTNSASNIACSTTAGAVQCLVGGGFTPPSGQTVATVDGTQSHTNGTGTTVSWTSKTPSGATDLFLGYAVTAASQINTGSTSGFVYFQDASLNMFIYSLAAPSPSAPTTTASSGAWDSLDGLLLPSSGAVGNALPRVVTQARNRAGAF